MCPSTRSRAEASGRRGAASASDLSFAATCERLARESRLDPALLAVSHAETFVAGCVDAALLGESRGLTWR